MHACAILLTSSAIMSGDKTCVTFFLAWHLAFHWIECGLAWTSSVHWIGCGLAWMPSASAMNPAPCCIDLCCYVHSSLLHWPLPPLSVSSICPFMLSWKCQVPKFSPAWHSIIVLHEVFLPLLWSYRVSPGPTWVSTHLQFDARCFPHVLSAVIHSGLRANEMLWSVSWCLGSHGSNILCFSPCPQGVSPSIYSLPLCFSLVRRAFLHQFWVINRSSWWIITSLSAVVFFELLLRLIMMDNNFRGRALLITSRFCSYTLSYIIQLVFTPAVLLPKRRSLY